MKAHKDKECCCKQQKKAKGKKCAKEMLDPVCEAPIENIEQHPLSQLITKYGIRGYDNSETTD